MSGLKNEFFISELIVPACPLLFGVGDYSKLIFEEFDYRRVKIEDVWYNKVLTTVRDYPNDMRMIRVYHLDDKNYNIFLGMKNLGIFDFSPETIKVGDE